MEFDAAFGDASIDPGAVEFFLKSFQARDRVPQTVTTSQPGEGHAKKPRIPKVSPGGFHHHDDFLLNASWEMVTLFKPALSIVIGI